MKLPANTPPREAPAREAPPLEAPARGAMAFAVVGGGIGAGLLGTSLHGHVWFPGADGGAVPLGAFLALLLLAAVIVLTSMWSRSAWAGVWCGAAAYVTAGLLSLPVVGSGLIFANVQGQVWLYGIAVVTLVAPLVAWRLLRTRKKRSVTG